MRIRKVTSEDIAKAFDKKLEKKVLDEKLKSSRPKETGSGDFE